MYSASMFRSKCWYPPTHRHKQFVAQKSKNKGLHHSESLKVIHIDMYFCEPQQMLVLDQLAYQHDKKKKKRKLISFQKALVYQWKASIHKGKELHLQV